LRFGYAFDAQLLPRCRVPKAPVPTKKTRARQVKRPETAEMGAEKGSRSRTRRATLRCTEMRCEIRVEPGYLKAELFDRQTPEETRDALAAIAAAARRHGCSQILISVHASRPISRVEQSRFLECFREFCGTPKHRIALTGDSDELTLSHQYVESVARRSGINIRSLPNEPAALDWLKDRRWTQDRRERQGPLDGKDRRRYWRRSLERIRPDSAGRVPG
jgi:hypothetical protein